MATAEQLTCGFINNDIIANARIFAVIQGGNWWMPLPLKANLT
jgi:hypothetical protein